MFLHKTQTKVCGYFRGLLSGLILLSLSAVANATFISSNFVDNSGYTAGVISGLNWDKGKMVRQTHNTVLSLITNDSLSLRSVTTAVQSDALVNNAGDIDPLSGANYYILIPETRPLTLTTGLLTTGATNSNAETFLVRESTSVPEPSSLLLMGIGLVGLKFVRQRK